jgi:hypothetical protein
VGVYFNVRFIEQASRKEAYAINVVSPSPSIGLFEPYGVFRSFCVFEF